MDVKCKAVTSRVPTFALPRQDTGQAALGERILSSRAELSAQFPHVFFLKANEQDQSAGHVDTKLTFR